jgi:aldose 1-epimerase
MAPTPTQTLNAGNLNVTIAPGCGGSITRFWQSGGADLELLRPASAEEIAANNPLAMASFPLVPFSNRIRNGKFTFDGKSISLPLNFGDHPHAIHGHGWQARWSVLAQSDRSLTLSYRHIADLWPWSYMALQQIDLSPQELSLTLSVRNDSDSDMPAGLGFHPYFPRTPESRISAGVDQIWSVDGEVMPLERVAPGEDNDPNTWIDVNGVALDNGYTAWQGEAVITWPERGAGLTMTATAPLNSLVVFTPPGEDFFCVEPVSHCTDAFNLAAGGDKDTGLQVLAPGETLSATVTFRPGLT